MAVARSSRPEKPAAFASAMGGVGAGKFWSGCALARKIAELALQGVDVLFVDLDRILVRLQPLDHPGVILLVAGAGRFLLGEFLPGIREHRLFLRKLLLQRIALLG